MSKNTQFVSIPKFHPIVTKSTFIKLLLPLKSDVLSCHQPILNLVSCVRVIMCPYSTYDTKSQR